MCTRHPPASLLLVVAVRFQRHRRHKNDPSKTETPDNSAGRSHLSHLAAGTSPRRIACTNASKYAYMFGRYIRLRNAISSTADVAKPPFHVPCRFIRRSIRITFRLGKRTREGHQVPHRDVTREMTRSTTHLDNNIKSQTKSDGNHFKTSANIIGTT